MTTDRFDPALVKGTTETLVFAVLASGPRHGYGIIQRIGERSADRLRMNEGALYPMLHRLEREGLVRSRDEEHGGRTRRVYALTAAGRRRLRHHAREWRAFAGFLDDLLGGAAGAST